MHVCYYLIYDDVYDFLYLLIFIFKNKNDKKLFIYLVFKASIRLLLFHFDHSDCFCFLTVTNFLGSIDASNENAIETYTNKNLLKVDYKRKINKE